MVFIPPGTFRMGSPTNEVDRWENEGPQTAVTISRGYWLGKNEVTQGEYLSLMNTNPSAFTGDPDRPVDGVSWEDATNYCCQLTEQERAAGRIATNSVYRLPTEAEWEYACRAWTSTRSSYGDDPGYTNLTNYAWSRSNSGETTHPVRRKLANPWGLYDMHGNVWEWCLDWFASYPAGIAVDPQGPATGSVRGPRWLHARFRVRLPRFPSCPRPKSALSRAKAQRAKAQEKANTLTTEKTTMKTKLIIRSALVSPADDRDHCRRVYENADSSHPPSLVVVHSRITATVFLVAASCLCLLPPTIAAPGSWTQKADMPGQASTPASCVVDGILYVMGGHYQLTNELRTVFAYDPRTNLWTRKADLPVARRMSAAAAVEGIIYVVGGNNGAGWTAVLPVVAYDPKTDIWVTKATIPTGRSTPAVCAVDGIIYAIGGFTAQNEVLARVDAYDPTTDQWTRKRDLPKPIFFATASAMAGKIYVLQGNDTFAYDPQTDQWTNKATFSPWSSGSMSVTVEGIIYLFGGMRQNWYGTGYDFALAYDPSQDRFSARRKMPRTRATGGYGVIDGKIYLAGGVDTEPVVQPAIYWKFLDEFDPQGGVTPQILNLSCESTNQVRLLWQGELGLRYGVESRPNVASGSWTRVMFSSGTNTVLATNSMVEVSCLVPTTDTNRFFRVLEL